MDSRRPKLRESDEPSSLVPIGKLHPAAFGEQLSAADIAVRPEGVALESVLKHQLGLHSFRNMSLMDAQSRKVRAF